MMKYDVIIIGAGAAGLMAAKTISKKGFSICILEAADEAGGRMHTIKTEGFDQPIESGAEFVHGKLPLTLKLMKKAGLKREKINGSMINVRNGERENNPDEKHWNQFLKKLKKQKEDISVKDFLDKYFSEEKYAELRNDVKHFSEGFDLADIHDASVLAAKKEWGHESETQYRISGGYIGLVNYFLDQCRKHKAEIHFHSFVKRIEHDEAGVKVSVANGNIFSAKKIIITASLGMLKSKEIVFAPPIPDHENAIARAGFGQVIKILIHFKEAFWQKDYGGTGFVLSNEKIPTWWMQADEKNTVLTGWVGGPASEQFGQQSEDDIFSTALESLSNIFRVPKEQLFPIVSAHRIFIWKNNPFSKGGYSYNAVDYDEIKSILNAPVQNRIFFAGEAYYEGESQGTVEAALQSGRKTAKRVIKVL